MAERPYTAGDAEWIFGGSDAEALEASGDAATTRFEDVRPSSAPELDSGTGTLVIDFGVLDLESMTEEVVDMFRQGQHQEALNVMIAFANAAREQLGDVHPTHINALATVAALVDQLGGEDEAKALLGEAEHLHEELEMDALADQLDQELGDLMGEEASNDEEEVAIKDALSRAQGSFSQQSGTVEPVKLTHAAGRREKDEESDVYSEDNWTGSGGSASGSDGDIDGDYGDIGDDDAEDEAEADAITRLTWEVNNLLEGGQPEQAAQLLSQAEKVLLIGGSPDMSNVSGLTRAALHTLWAAVLDSVGESEKAQQLQNEALNILEDEIGIVVGPGNSSDTTSLDATDDESEEEEDEDDSETESGVAEGQTAAQGEHMASCDNGASAADDAAGSFFLTGEDALDQEWKKTWGKDEPTLRCVDENDPQAEQAAKSCDVDALAAVSTSTTPLAPPLNASRMPTPPQTVKDTTQPSPSRTPVPPRTDDPTAQGPPCDSSADASRVVADDMSKDMLANDTQDLLQPTSPTLPKPKAGSRGRRIPLAPPTSQAPASGQPAKAGARTGGGFVAGKSGPLSAAKASAKKKSKAKAKTKAADVSGGAAACEEDEEEDAAKEGADEDNDATELDNIPSQEEAAKELTRAMTCADHYLGLFNFEKAADKLEEQLVKLADSASPQRHSDLHIDVLAKYGGVLWWDGDPEGAIDAFTAADEILEERPQAEIPVRRRRVDVWAQLAQVHRAIGDLETADERLSEAVRVLSEIAAAGGVNEGHEIPVHDALRDAQAALGQVCVQKQDYGRAEELYVSAFAPDCETEQPIKDAKPLESSTSEENALASMD